jgi:hypothetical protein
LAQYYQVSEAQSALKLGFLFVLKAIQKIIYMCVEITKRVLDPLGHSLVDEFMLHGSCGELNQKRKPMYE